MPAGSGRPPEALSGRVAILRSLRRILARSGADGRAFLLGVGLRGLERVCEMLPYLLAYLWLASLPAPASFPLPPWLPLPAALALALLGVLGLQWALAFHGQRLCFLGSYRIIGGYRERLIDHVRGMPLGNLQRQRVGQLADSLTDDVRRLEGIFTHVAADCVAALCAALAALALLAWADWRLALALALPLPLAAAVLQAGAAAFERAGLRKHGRYREAAALLVEFIGGLPTLRLYDRTGDWLRRLDACFGELRRLSLGIEKWGGGPVMGYRLLVEGGVACLLAAIAWLGLPPASTLAPAAVLLALLLAYKVVGPLLEVAEYLVMLRYACQSEIKLEALWRVRPLPEPWLPRRPNGHGVRFERVSFAYAGERVLHDISFTVPERSLTAIVGPSGSGKSTLLHLLARFHDPDEGRICLGGVDARALGSAQWYGALSMVFQQVQLFDGSIEDNLRLGRAQASDAAVWAACRAADCEAFIRALPEGMRTRVGEGGLSLSGGERQRLSIARALLKDAPLLLLDEVTAAVDPASQSAIQRALNRLAAERTVIMVAHRLHTIRHADQIVVLRQGRIAETGTHAQLLRRGGLYAELWAAQSGPEQGA